MILLSAIGCGDAADRRGEASKGSESHGDDALADQHNEPVELRDPAELLVVIQAEIDGKPLRARIGCVIAVDDERAYVRVGRFALPRDNNPNRPSPVVRYFALKGPADSTERLELEFVVSLEEQMYAILTGPRSQLPPRPPQMKLPEVQEGSMLTFVGFRLGENSTKPNLTRLREPVKLTRMMADSDGITYGFQLSGMGGEGFLIDDRGELVAACQGDSDHFYAFGEGGFQPRSYFQRHALRTRVSRPTDDEVVVEFIEQTIDPFDTGLKPRMLVAHPTKAQADLPAHELLHGEKCFGFAHGVWLKPKEGTAVEMRRVEHVDDTIFSFPPVSAPWCRPTLWYGTYRFRISERLKPVWYQGVAIDAEGKLVQPLGRDSHLYFPNAAGEAILFKHPVYQYDQGTPVRMPSP